MKKNGFTLVELLSVIAILMVLAGLPKYGLSTSKNSSHNKQWESKKALVESAAERWADDNRYKFATDSCQCVKIDTLVKGNYFKITDNVSDSYVLINNVTDEKVSKNKEIKVVLENDVFYATYPDSTCSCS